MKKNEFEILYYVFLQRISVLVHCGLQMCRGGTNDPTVAIQIWSIGVFDKERNPKYTDTLFAHLRPRLNYIPAERYTDVKTRAHIYDGASVTEKINLLIAENKSAQQKIQTCEQQKIQTCTQQKIKNG